MLLAASMASMASDEPAMTSGRALRRPPGRLQAHAEARSARPRWRSWARRAIGTLTACVVLFLAGLGVLLLSVPGAGDLARRVAAHDAAAHVSDPGTAVPARFAAALIATEDSRFETHHGLDARGVVRGLLGPLTGGGDHGGATLDQQLAKLLYTGGRDGIAQKIEQVGIALKIDADHPKAEILRDYAATVYFGHGYTGLTAASRGYFRVDPQQLSWAQASMLAGVVQAPSDYDPITHFGLARQRQRMVLDRLVATGTLTRVATDQIYATPLRLHP